ncbi:MAG: DUF6079 family protein, partial [Firmicutes bacterium]|nr:DUF6079 family protein [Bacillota bacterium]
MKIADLISVPPVRTVIRLSDLRHPERSRELAETFVLTNEAEEALATILEAVAQGQGRGFFLQGNYGSGKSHLLTVLSLLLEQPEAWGSLPGLGETALARLAPDPVTPKQEGTNPAGTGLRPQDQPQPGPQVPSIRETLPARPTSLDRPAGLWPGRYLVLNISLVEHSGGEYL